MKNANKLWMATPTSLLVSDAYVISTSTPRSTLALASGVVITQTLAKKMKLIATLAALIISAAAISADITHENQFSAEEAKAWDSTGNGYDGDYAALEGDHTGTSTVHIRSYSEGGVLFLWLTVISQDDLAVLPKLVTFPKFERTRTNGTFKAHDKVYYIKFVSFGDAKGVIVDDRFYRQTNG